MFSDIFVHGDDCVKLVIYVHKKPVLLYFCELWQSCVHGAKILEN